MSLAVAPGEVVGIAGPNGAGKSTLLAMLLGFLAPTTGRVTLDGAAPRTFVEREGVGYLSELVAIPREWRAAEALRRYAVLDGVAEREVGPAVEAAIARLGLEEHRDKKIRQLSKGNAQRVGLAQALLRPHRIVVLDEPTHGLDPVWTQRFRGLVEGLRDPARAVLIASHNLDELERVADRVVILDHGRVQRIVDLRAAAGHAAGGRWRVVVADGAAALAAHLPAAREIGTATWDVEVDDLAAFNRALAAAIGAGLVVRQLGPAESGLERQFREAVGGAS
ncbi:MAG: ABC transporter ATP-binding protein [Gemmatimonadaceae bacterium]|nr:ABC transporter ATP-binding protein [Gemmatimonadaceae bacterium]